MSLARRLGWSVWVVVFACVVAWAKPKLQTSWAAPDLAPLPNAKVLVLALVSEEANKRVLEDALVAELKAKKVDAIPAYANLAPEDLASAETIRAKAQTLGVNAGLVVKSKGVQQQVKSTPSASVSVGVPVQLGMFSVFAGTSVPLGGGSTTVQVATVDLQYFVEKVDGARWMATYAIDLGDGAQAAAGQLAAAAVKQLKKAKAIG